MKKLSFEETVCVAVNSIAEGLIDRLSAIKMIIDAYDEQIYPLKKSLNAALATIERAVDEYQKSNELSPLDDITIGEAFDLYINEDMLLHCRDGHAVAMFREIHKEPLAG